ncbi:MAG TPA: GDP-mannose 4,6-dehydratase [Clostridiales bacterium]|nr:GDP-mannose 4,6-dehydratase [Clostridiales bacterium]
MKNALITGISGQDGSYLTELLLEKGYNVYGLFRRRSTGEYGNVAHLADKIHFIYGDMSDLSSLITAIIESNPDEIYNLAAQSYVAVSWAEPLFTNDVNGAGVAKLLEAVKLVKPDTRVYQASTSEMFGKVQQIPQSETTPFYPRSPYGVSKLYAHWIAKNYRESYNMFVSCGILFNHESQRRGKEFVTRKITNTVAKIKYGKTDCLYLGNLDSKRDWGHSKDYVYAMWKMLQHTEPDDFVIATGKTYTVREFVEAAFLCVGINIVWQGKGANECGIDAETKKTLVKVDNKLYRPAEVELLMGDSTKAQKLLNWYPKYNLQSLVKCMIDNDLELEK